jgi:LytS/YehU family sensor histidine kinase
VSGELPDTTPRFELGIGRDWARSRAESRIAWFYAVTAIVALVAVLGVLLVGRIVRGRHLRATQRSLAESELRAAKAETAATRAGLAAVQARLHPHFLSNALHSVAALIPTDPGAAEDALDRLGDLFRYSLEQSARQSVVLEDEWHFVEDYLAIERMRLGPRLQVEMEIDPAATECEVPSFVLQPLVENAVRHGVGPRRMGGKVHVSARLIGRVLELAVVDDGVGADPSGVRSSSGTGIRTLCQRLSLDPAFAGHLEIDTAPNAGFRARVWVTTSAGST